MQGSTGPVLTLTNLQPGELEFTLQVVDAKGQKDSTGLRLVVLPRQLIRICNL